MHLLPDPVPWYLVGPLMGLTVAGMYAVANRHLGVNGAYVQVIDGIRHRPVEAWRLWFLGGLILGSAAVAVLAGSPQQGLRYGRLGELVPLGALVPLLFVGGILIGVGARWAGACTSGHGLTGCSVRSPGSFVATATFFGTAVAVTMILHIVTGGAL